MTETGDTQPREVATQLTFTLDDEYCVEGMGP